ncbi:TolB family protein [Acanthopleuribacter pedis]|uniref:Uncharacterized protein n=1 Tax=Acanthopleuribacter pedis TaxID=442870 RepID=A0A8J7Q9L4_9BACT|nr:hypothetical protein [Acanthopleuribacter pedis]MBO1321196.1 hypothetical protein [Acanthopleuribacter pedis]
MTPFVWIIGLMVAGTTTSFQLPSTEIFVAESQIGETGITLTKVMNVTKNDSYDNQPYFIDNHLMAYSADNGQGATDIRIHNFADGSTRTLRATPESEFSPTLTPDGKHLSCIRVEEGGAQRLWQFPLDGGAPQLLHADLRTVGYHTWLGKKALALFLVGEPHRLVQVQLPDGKPITLAENIDRGLSRIPGSQSIAYIQREKEGGVLLATLTPGKEDRVMVTPTAKESVDMLWLAKDRVLMARGGVIYQFVLKKSKQWRQVADLTKEGVTEITRLAINPDQTRLALVVNRP